MEDSKSRSLNRSHYLTAPERMFLEECKRQNLNIEKQYPLKNSFILDFAIPDKRIAIEIDGNHWHNFPNGTYRDKMKTAILKRKGWIVLRFWESEIYNDVGGAVSKVSSLSAS